MQLKELVTKQITKTVDDRHQKSQLLPEIKTSESKSGGMLAGFNLKKSKTPLRSYNDLFKFDAYNSDSAKGSLYDQKVHKNAMFPSAGRQSSNAPRMKFPLIKNMPHRNNGRAVPRSVGNLSRASRRDDSDDSDTGR